MNTIRPRDTRLIGVVKAVVHEPGNEGRLANCSETITFSMVRQTNKADHGLPLCSPRKTSLNFLKGLLNSADADIITGQIFLFERFGAVGVFCYSYPLSHQSLLPPNIRSEDGSA